MGADGRPGCLQPPRPSCVSRERVSSTGHLPSLRPTSAPARDGYDIGRLEIRSRRGKPGRGDNQIEATVLDLAARGALYFEPFLVNRFLVEQKQVRRWPAARKALTQVLEARGWFDHQVNARRSHS
jgi:hypothetical protein